MTEVVKQSKVYLTIEQKHAIVVWLLENGLLTQDKNSNSTDPTHFKGKRTDIAYQLKTVFPNLDITPANMKASVDFFNRVNKCFGYRINVPAVQDTVERDMLVARVKTLEAQNAKLGEVIRAHKEPKAEAIAMTAYCKVLEGKLQRINELVEDALTGEKKK